MSSYAKLHYNQGPNFSVDTIALPTWERGSPAGLCPVGGAGAIPLTWAVSTAQGYWSGPGMWLLTGGDREHRPAGQVQLMHVNRSIFASYSLLWLW